jgi:hypothetical protein
MAKKISDNWALEGQIRTSVRLLPARPDNAGRDPAEEQPQNHNGHRQGDRDLFAMSVASP